MVFCAYCGQKFKRKEHLERHLPSHTNVKPHKCGSCHLSFARRDLLRKHSSLYHEVDESNTQLLDGERRKAQPKPIACTKCASTKAACDKKVPCSRCIDKNLPCEARFACRSANRRLIRATSPTKTLKPQYQTTQETLKLQEVEAAATKLHMTGGDQFLQDPYNADLLMWETSHMQGLNYSAKSTEIRHNCEPARLGNHRISTGNVDVDPQITNFEDIQMWSDYSMEGGKDFSDAALPFPASLSMNTDETHNFSLPLTSLSISPTTSGITSWKGSIDSRIQEPTIYLAKLDDGIIPELEVVIAGEEAWPLARCNPQIFSPTCPQTALVYLQNFQDCSKLEDAWNSINNLPYQTTKGDVDQYQYTIAPLVTTTRDKIIAIAQSFLQKALRTHQSFHNKQGVATSFFTLPPSNIMENLLGSAMRSLSPYYTLFQGTTLDPNELIRDNDTSILLFLLIIALGASLIPEARTLAAGLTETCRISLFNIIEKNVELSADPIVLKSALLFTILGAWGGDAWHINIAIGQRAMYLTMLKHAGMLEAQAPIHFGNSSNIEPVWKEWQFREHKNRLVYNWVIVDQELSLFHDIAPILSITELQTPLPEDESLWRAENAVQWLDIYELYAKSSNAGHYSSAHPKVALSLSYLFQDMLHDELEIRSHRLLPLRLRLLLHPLQLLVYHLGLVSYFSGIYDNHRSSRPLAIASTLLRLEEVQSLLHKWYDLCMINAKETPNCIITNNSLALWYLISLNAISCFPEIEKSIRNSTFHKPTPETVLHSHHLIYQPEKAIFYCGQVLKIVAAMPKSRRPPWWSAAIYRATIILLANSISRPPRGQIEEKGPLIIINLVTSEDPTIKAYLGNSYGIPVLLNGNGSLIKLDSPDHLLTFCITLLEEGISTRFSDGIRRKLQKVLHVYEGKEKKASTGSNI